jgi:hypothetical protein
VSRHWIFKTLLLRIPGAKCLIVSSGNDHIPIAIITTPTFFYWFGIVAMRPRNFSRCRMKQRLNRFAADYTVHVNPLVWWAMNYHAPIYNNTVTVSRHDYSRGRGLTSI